jgi:uncharacterized protein DUF4177
MQRWEYKVVSLREGHYTDALNEYGRDGWELVSVASEAPRDVPAPERGGTLPMPRAFGVLGDAAAKLNKLGAGDSTEAQAGNPSTPLLWVLRRPLGED